MTQLIPLHSQTIDDNTVETVSARELHEFLGNGDMFANWIKHRVEKYGFVENQDFISFLVATKKPNGGRPSQEYYITLDMAKQLAMVENNEKGMQVRKYFIECEKQLNAQQSQLPTTYLEALEALLASEKAKLTLEQQASINAPKVAHYDRVADRKNLVNASQVGAKVGLSAVKLNKLLDDFGVYNKSVKRNARTFNLWFIERSFGEMKQSEAGYDQALFTHKGEAWFIEKLTNEGVVA